MAMHNKFPLWKNAILILVALVALVYALPNLYSEDPVVQISSSESLDTSALQTQVQDILKTEGLPYRSIQMNDTGLVIRLKSTDTQLLVRDTLKSKLGTKYVIALNLSPSTPTWLQMLHAEPMKQGLDLRGGVHFLLAVDVDSVVHHRYEGISRSISQDLREESIRYSGIRYVSKKGIIVRFRSNEARDAAVNAIEQRISDVDIKMAKHSSSIIVQLLPREFDLIRQRTIEQTMAILRNRVNELGVGEAVVQQQGATRISVDLPGIQDAARAKQILGGTATLQFYLVDSEHDAQRAKETGVVPVGSKLYQMDGQPILLKRQMVLSGDSITSAVSSIDQQTATPNVQIQLGGGGESFFTKITRDNVGQRMAIVYVETKVNLKSSGLKTVRSTQREERVISAPVIQSALGNNFQITGLSDAKEASNLALLLRAGALPTAIYPIEERTVGPTLGKENIQRGLVSLEVGMALILVLMVLYYRTFGLIANIALILNLILLSAILSIIGATLTLPGMAGIVLTVGMAVDANVLIYERIREELRHGLSPQAAIYAGYERAFSTILDANVTTLIVGIVLFSIGTGPVQGFAITLSIGLLTSMLTGVTYTRAMVNAIYGGRERVKLSIGI